MGVFAAIAQVHSRAVTTNISHPSFPYLTAIFPLSLPLSSLTPATYLPYSSLICLLYISHIVAICCPYNSHILPICGPYICHIQPIYLPYPGHIPSICLVIRNQCAKTFLILATLSNLYLYPLKQERFCVR
jgi:hypothetical protein